MNIFNYLCYKLKEPSIVYTIILYSHNTINQDLKKDISTFNFIWNAIQEKYVNLSLYVFIGMGIDKRTIYLEILSKIEQIIIENKTPKNSNRYKIKKKKPKMFDRITFKKKQISVNSILNKWCYHQNFLGDLTKLTEVELVNLTKNFILIFNPVNRLRLMKKLNMI